MSTDVVVACLLIAVPIAFNGAFFALGRAFDYPNILRKEPDEILRRFAAGGPGLLLRWQALLLSALAMLPLVALLTVVLAAPAELSATTIVVGAAAALVQALGIVRWPFAVPELARRYVAAQGPDAESTRRAIELVFATIHRLLGVGIGEHLGYLLTGVWTLLVAASILSTVVLPGWLGLIGILIGIALLIGALEFVGRNEPKGWPLAGVIVPIAYICWSIWLVALGVVLLLWSQAVREMTSVEQAAVVAVALVAAAAAFQVALAAGLPLGEATMGGRAATVGGVLTPRYRAIALVSAAVLVVAAWITLAQAGLVSRLIDGQLLAWGTWVVAGFMLLNTLTNLSGRHPLERWGMSSLTLVAALLIGFIAYAA